MDETNFENDPDSLLRDRLADALMAEAVFDGWSRASLAAASSKLDLPAGEADRLFPGGPVQALTYVSERADRRTVEGMENEGVAPQKIRDRIKSAARISVHRHTGVREAAPCALALPALRLNAGLGLDLLSTTV